MRPRISLCLALTLALGADATPQTGQKVRPAVTINCTPTTVQIGQVVQKVKNPIPYAINRAGPGSSIYLDPGRYPGFCMGLNNNADYNVVRSGSPGRPITIIGRGDVTIARVQSGSGDTISVWQNIPVGHFTFKNIKFECSPRAAILFANTERSHDGFRFHDCDILGGFDHSTGEGWASSWGVHSYALKDFEFRGVTRQARVTNIRDMHAFYLHNNRGDVLIENVLGANLGRTFCQIAARQHAGAPGIGTTTIRNCEVSDCGIARMDGYKGGSAFTLFGRHTGTLVIENCTYRSGFNPELTHLKQRGSVYGTGALVCDESGQVRSGTLIVRDNDFRFHPQAGDRPALLISGIENLRFEGRNVFHAGASGVVLTLDPWRKGTIGNIFVSQETEMKGAIKLRGEVLSSEERARLGLPMSQ